MSWSLFLKFIPPVLLYSLFVWSYCVYVIHHLSNQLPHKETFIAFLSVLLLMTMWCLLATLLSKHNNVPLQFRPSPQIQKKVADSDDDGEKNELLVKFVEANKLPIMTRTRDCKIRCPSPGGVTTATKFFFIHLNYCLKCGHVKPDRCHHCSSCDACRLKMDHHCPWINKCVAFSNYKKFVNLLLFASLFCAYHFGTSLPFLINQWQKGNLTNHLHFVISCTAMCFTFVVIAPFLLFHLSMIFKNVTTLETLYPTVFCPEGLTFNLGCCKNYRAVFGSKCLLWCLPLDINEDDGISFQVVEKKR